MAIQSNYNKVCSSSYEKLMSTQVVVKANMDASEDVKMVLGTSAEAKPIAIEPMQGEVMVNGKVNFKTIYYTSDGVQSLDYNSDFTEKLKNEDIMPSSNLIVKMNVIDTDSTVSGNDIILTCVCEITVEEMKSMEYDALIDVEDSVFTKKAEMNCQYMKVMAEGAFEMYDEIEAQMEIDKILVYDANVCMTSYKCYEDKIMMNGEAHAMITYKSGEMIMTKNIMMPFSEELDAEGADDSCMIMPKVMIKNKRIVLSGAKEDKMMRVEMVIGMKAMVMGYKKDMIVTDMYSTDYDIKMQEMSMDNWCMMNHYCFNEKISAMAMLNENMPPIAKVCAVCLSQNNLANLIAYDNEIVAEGLMSACVMYLDDDNICRSVKAEMPYSLKIMAEGVKEGDMLEGNGVVCNVMAMAKSPNEIEMKADIRISMINKRQMSYKYIMKAEQGEMKKMSHNAMSIMIASGGEEMWDIVKCMAIAPEEIMIQNPNMQIPLMKGDKIKIYRTM